MLFYMFNYLMCRQYSDIHCTNKTRAYIVGRRKQSGSVCAVRKCAIYAPIAIIRNVRTCGKCARAHHKTLREYRLVCSVVAVKRRRHCTVVSNAYFLLNAELTTHIAHHHATACVFVCVDLVLLWQSAASARLDASAVRIWCTCRHMSSSARAPARTSRSRIQYNIV